MNLFPQPKNVVVTAPKTELAKTEPSIVHCGHGSVRHCGHGSVRHCGHAPLRHCGHGS